MELKQTYLELSNKLYTRMEQLPFQKIEEVVWNSTLNQQLGNPFVVEEEKYQILLGNHPSQKLFAQAYAGHQYGHFTMLGDGRAMIIGELQNKAQLYDLQWKGSGRTPYSKRGDGKATLESMLREYLMSEAMHKLDVPTTRSLAVYKTGEMVQRTTVQQGAMVLRVAASHIRVGTFEYVRSLDDMAILQEFTDYTIQRHYPHLSNHPDKYEQFFQEVVKTQAKLIAKWQSLGFVHGVMNTDNMAISGETIDYGPCAFLDEYDPSVSFSSIDQNGRYAYFRQPYIASWNLSKLAVSILPLIDSDVHSGVDKLNKILMSFEEHYQLEYRILVGKKLGLKEPSKEDDSLIAEWLRLLQQYRADFTNSFYHLTTGNVEQLSFSMVERTLFLDSWTKRIEQDGTIEEARKRMKQVNPVIIPRNHLVKEAVEKADFEDDMTQFHQLLSFLSSPFDYNKHIPETFRSPSPNNTQFVSYCGT